MNVSIHIICASSSWNVHKDRVAQFCHSLNIDKVTRIEPKAYWKDNRFFEFEFSFFTSSVIDDIFSQFQSIYGIDNIVLFQKGNNVLEIGILSSIPEMLDNRDKVFIMCYAANQ